MRKLVSILFLTVLVFNILGSYGVFMSLRFHNELQMVQALDEGQYDHSQTITLKLPLTVPYANDSREYSRVDGSFTLDGNAYRLVKQALVKDTLHIVCVRDDKATLIDKVLVNIVETFSDNPSGQESQTLDFIKDYLTTSLTVVSASSGWQREVSEVIKTAVFRSPDKASVIHPPERA